MNAGTSALALHYLRVRRAGRDVLDVPHIEVDVGETLAVLGPNGAGKSTLLLAAALLLPADGEVTIFGEMARRGVHVRLRRQTATVFQDAALLDMTVRQNVEIALAMHGVGGPERRTRAEEWLGRLGVAHLARQRGHAVSGGEAQRVSLARAFAVRPRLLFLDEPFAGVDHATRATLTGELRALLAAEGTAALFATHDHSEALLLAPRVVLLDAGRPLQVGPATDVLARPESDRAARFLGFSVLGPASCTLLGLRPVDGVTRAAIAPEAARLDAGGVLATVRRVEAGAGAGRLLVELASGDSIAIARPVETLRDASLAAGREVRVAVDEARVVWLAR
ncbi:MAG: ABC transporter ATP-binding protein [Dehalococcoidia bacterium]|nr:MAG: ABC transporter ATP-binding protein [Dehalococcoidia bacterium]